MLISTHMHAHMCAHMNIHTHTQYSPNGLHIKMFLQTQFLIIPNETPKEKFTLGQPGIFKYHLASV